MSKKKNIKGRGHPLVYHELSAHNLEKNMKKLLVAACVLLCSVQSFAEVTLTPRISYYFDNVLQRTSDIDNSQEEVLNEAAQQTETLLQDIYGPDASFGFDDFNFGTQADQISLLMYGGSISIGGDTTQFTLTGLYGDTTQNLVSTTSATSTTTILGLQAEDIVLSTSQGRTDSERIDIEATIQHRVSETVALVGGIRYERLKNDGLITTDGVSSVNNLNLINLIEGIPQIDLTLLRVPSERTYTSTDELYSARFGASAYSPFGRNSGAFLVGMLHVSHQPAPRATGVDSVTGPYVQEGLISDETSIGPDLSVGIQWGISENVSLDLRYRATVYFPVSSGKSSSDSRINHGASLGLSFRL